MTALSQTKLELTQDPRPSVPVGWLWCVFIAQSVNPSVVRNIKEDLRTPCEYTRSRLPHAESPAKEGNAKLTSKSDRYGRTALS